MYPPIIEDLTLTFPPKTHIGPVLESIRLIDPLIHLVTLKDSYLQNYTFTLTYQSYSQSLKDTQIEPLRRHIVDTLEGKFNAQLVGTLKPSITR
jgi:phenylalanyl-tRNA synthetase beta subunit